MLTKPQIWTIKAAQRQAGIRDDEYRQTLAELFGVNTSKDPALGDDAFDVLMSYFEAIYWRGVDSGALQPPCTGKETFRQRGYWAAKNPAGNTSRDRYAGDALHEEIEEAESRLVILGFGQSYLSAIRHRVCGESNSPPRLRAYLAALNRTLKAKEAKIAQPF